MGHRRSLGAGTLRTLENARAAGWGQIVVAVWRGLAEIVGLGRDLYGEVVGRAMLAPAFDAHWGGAIPYGRV